MSISPNPNITHALQPMIDAGLLAGAVTLVADKNEILSLNTLGFTNLAAHTPMQANTMFWVASQTKPITAALLMMLVDQGKVSLEDHIVKYLPEFNDQWLAVEKDDDHILLRRPGLPITVRQILSHTSGMPFRSAMEDPTLDALPLHVAVRSYAMTPLQSEPETKYSYSNAGINTAGRIIEVVSGMPYETFLQDRLLTPLGMSDTTFWPNAEQISRLATPYQPNEAKTAIEETKISQFSYPLDNPKRQPMPAGGLFSTASDVSKFCQMLLNGGIFEDVRYLTEASIGQMTSRQTDASLPENSGLALALGDGTYGHGGALATNMTIDTTHGLILVYLVQSAGWLEGGEKSLSAFQEAARQSSKSA